MIQVNHLQGGTGSGGPAALLHGAWGETRDGARRKATGRRACSGIGHRLVPQYHTKLSKQNTQGHHVLSQNCNLMDERRHQKQRSLARFFAYLTTGAHRNLEILCIFVAVTSNITHYGFDNFNEHGAELPPLDGTLDE